jgi:histidinol-phosphate aminotransferase
MQERIYHALLEKQIVVRDRSRVELCDDCLRITVGTPNENKPCSMPLMTAQ